MISGNELRDAVRQAQADTLEDYDAVDSLNDWSASRFTALDQNRDGRITRAEWHFASTPSCGWTAIGGRS